MLVQKRCENEECRQLFETTRPRRARYCSARCRLAVFRAKALGVTANVSSVAQDSVSGDVTAEVDPVVNPIFLPEERVLASLENCERELVNVYRQTRLGRRDSMDGLRLCTIIEKIRDMLEAKRQIELENKPAEGRYVTSICVRAVKPGDQVVSWEHSQLINALVEAGKIDEAWVELLGRKPPDPRLTSIVTDPDTGEYLDPATLTVLPKLLPPST